MYVYIYIYILYICIIYTYIYYKRTYILRPSCFCENNQPVIDGIKKLNSRKKALSIATYDFSTLYTNIQYNELRNVMRELKL